MSNSSKMIFVAGAVLVSVVIIALSLFVFSNAQGRVNDSMKTMSSSEVEGFNSTYVSYQGKQNGSQVKAMINRILANVNTYEEIPEQIPCVSYNTAMNSSEKDPNKNLDGVSVGVKYSKQTAMYLSYLNFLSKGLEAKHTYYIVIVELFLALLLIMMRIIHKLKIFKLKVADFTELQALLVKNMRI